MRLLRTLLPPSLAGLLLLALGHPRAGLLLLALAGSLALVGGFAPWGLDALDRVLARLSRGIGLFLSALLATALYLVAFTFARILWRIFGRDPLERAFPTRQPSYWTPRSPARAPDAPLRQF